MTHVDTLRAAARKDAATVAAAEIAPSQEQDAATSTQSPNQAVVTVAAAAAAPAPVPQYQPQASGGAPPADKPLLALDTLKTLLALKLKRGVEEVPDTATIHALVGGKSALQNEIIGDVEAEFGDTPDGSADLPLGELSKTIGVGCVGARFFCFLFVFARACEKASCALRVCAAAAIGKGREGGEVTVRITC